MTNPHPSLDPQVVKLEEAESIMVRRESRAKMDKGSIAFAKLRQSYMVFNKTTGKSPRTVDWYDSRIELFERFLGPEAKLGDLTVARVRE
jgi:hypothetical protein